MPQLVQAEIFRLAFFRYDAGIDLRAMENLHNIRVRLGLVVLSAKHKITILRLFLEQAQGVSDDPTERHLPVTGFAFRLSNGAELSARCLILSVPSAFPSYVFPRQSAQFAAAQATEGSHHKQGATLQIWLRSDDAPDFGN